MKDIVHLDKSYFDYLVEIARNSTCHRSKCGSIIINSSNEIIGVGYNSMPCDETKSCFKDSLSDTFKSDKTCCVHAEQRAIFNALSISPDTLKGSSLYFIRLDDDNNPKHSGEPYCTICSKMALDVGISTFCLWHKEGWTGYEANYYNQLSFKLQENN